MSKRSKSSALQVLGNGPAGDEHPDAVQPAMTVDVLLVAACDLATVERDWDTAEVLIRLIERRLPSRAGMTEEQRQQAIIAIEQARAICAQGRTTP